MKWPWVSRARLEAEERNRQIFADATARLYTEMHQRDGTIRVLQQRVQSLLGMDGSAARLAEVFSDMNADQQAEFFSRVTEIMEAWTTPAARVMQLHYIGRSDKLTGGAVQLLLEVADVACVERFQWLLPHERRVS